MENIDKIISNAGDNDKITYIPGINVSYHDILEHLVIIDIIIVLLFLFKW
jgi:hypothetical protein